MALLDGLRSGNVLETGTMGFHKMEKWKWLMKVSMMVNDGFYDGFYDD